MYNNITVRYSIQFILLLILLFCFFGCGNNGRKVESVTGQVMFNGIPLRDAQICFLPKKPDGFAAVGETDADGKFTLITPGSAKPGVIQGEYYVVITKNIAVDDYGKPLTPETTPKDVLEGARIPKLMSLIPEKYGQPNKSPLDATVVSGKNTFLFELSNK
jgi:hypothetical protein